MEHEIFHSELKPSIDDGSLSKIIRCSSSGENSHRAAAMVLIFERSVRERRERMATRVRDSLRQRPPPEPKRSNERVNNPVQSAGPLAPAPQPVSRPPPKLQSTSGEAAQNLKPVPRPEPTQKTIPAVTQNDTSTHRKSMPNLRTSDSKPPEDTFLRCSVRSCRVSLGRNELKDGLYCGVCQNRAATLCANCGVCRNTIVKHCKGCGLKFMR